jgi:hypothetical protein
LEKVVVLVILSIAKLGLLFLDFCTILNEFYNFSCNTPKDKNLLALGSLEVFESSQPYPRFPSLEPDGKGELASGEVEHGVANKRRGR